MKLKNKSKKQDKSKNQTTDFVLFCSNFRVRISEVEFPTLNFRATRQDYLAKKKINNNF